MLEGNDLQNELKFELSNMKLILCLSLNLLSKLRKAVILDIQESQTF